MNIWLISIFEQTFMDKVFSTRFLSIAEYAKERGHSVDYFASTFKHNTKNQRFDKTTEIQVEARYNVTYIKSISYSENVSFKRLFSHYKFGKSVINEFIGREKPDVILIAFPPITLTNEVMKWATDNNIPVIIDIIDPWPDIFLNALPSPVKPIVNLYFSRMRFKLGKTFNRAFAITAFSNQYLSWAKSFSADIRHTACFYPAHDFDLIQEHLKIAANTTIRDESKLTVIYAGSLASSYDIPCILGAAEILERRMGTKIRFIIAGVGPQQNIVEEYSKTHRNLEYLGRITKEELMQQYYLSDLGLTQHISEATQSVTYKLFDLLSCGIPILNSLKSEMNDIIVDNEVGLFNEPGDVVQLAENILKLYYDSKLIKKFKSNAIALTKRIGDIKIVYNDFVDLIELAGNSKEMNEK